MKPYISYILIFFVVASCSNSADKESKRITKVAATKEEALRNEANLEIDSSILAVDSTTILGHNYFAYNINNVLFILNEIGDTLLTYPDLNGSFEFTYFNNDKEPDLIIRSYSNTPNVCDLYLFDKSIMTFHEVENFVSVPSPEKINNTNIYYSYHRSGCADINWDSDLFLIENYKVKKLGNIKGRGCDKKDKDYGITVYRLLKDNNIKVDYFPIDKIVENNDLKWDFIKNYWEKNFKRFS